MNYSFGLPGAGIGTGVGRGWLELPLAWGVDAASDFLGVTATSMQVGGWPEQS